MRERDELVGDDGTVWPAPATEPATEPVDRHTGPLDDDEDGRFLLRDDPRRIGAERRRCRAFDTAPDDEDAL